MTQEDDTSLRNASSAPSPAPSSLPTRWDLLRDVAVFQAKLIFDGLRDLFLSPLSLIATLIGLIAGGDNPGRYFYALLHMGKRTEHWIGLFSAADRSPEHGPEAGPQSDPGAPPKTSKTENFDQVFGHVEGFARSRYERDGWLAKSKNGVDRGIDWVNHQVRRLTGDDKT